jgi:hypothetical protein
MHCHHFVSFYKAANPVKSFTYAHASVEAHSLLIDYLYRTHIPSGPEGVNRRSTEGKTYINQMHGLFYLAKSYRSRDLMNRVMDRIQTFDHKCGGSMYRRHLRTIYAKTTIGSPLRWYYSIASASFLALATASSNYQRRADKIMAVRNLKHQFKADLGRARTQLKKKIALGKLDFRDQISFGICEFHTHKVGDVCPATIPSTQASTTAARNSETRSQAQEASFQSNAAEDLVASGQGRNSSDGEASLTEVE